MHWGVCTTAKAPLDQILAFIAWHKHLGAAKIWVHLDRPTSPDVKFLGELEGVEVIACDDLYWGGKRPKRQEVRQGHNIQRVYALAQLPVIAHLDIDEFLWPMRSMSEILAGWPGNQPFIRARPAEALHNPKLPDDIFTARKFRLPFPNAFPDARKERTLGEYALALPSGMLSHKVGKSLFRTGIGGLVPRLHSASMGHDAKPLHMPFHPDLFVLHFHAQDKQEWIKAVPQKTEHGAYRFNKLLAWFLKEATTEELNAFYEATQTERPELIAALREDNLLIEADLGLRQKVASLF